MFEMHDATFSYGDNTVLTRFSRRFEPGRLIAIAGANGAGKSTILKLLTGELKAASGHVLFRDHEVGQTKPAELAMYRAVLPQNSELSFPFTVHEVAGLGLSASGLDGVRKKHLIREALTSVDLGGYQARFYQQLSGGEQQRVQLARVLCQLLGSPIAEERKYLLLDEPVSSLDIRHQFETMQLARRYAQQGLGVIAVLHDLNLVSQFADEVVIMHEGCSIADGTPEQTLREDVLETAFGIRLQVKTEPGELRPHIMLPPV